MLTYRCGEMFLAVCQFETEKGEMMIIYFVLNFMGFWVIYYGDDENGSESEIFVFAGSA